MRLVTRFAPAPTGYLHLGHVVSAMYVWQTAREMGARVVLRIEDHDRIRSRPEYERALLEDLVWLGFAPDEEPVRQSDRGAIYEEALVRLRRSCHVYACECSRATHQGEWYPGTCRDRELEDGPGRGLRVELAPGLEVFDDLRLGRIAQEPSTQCGDLLIRDRNGHWTYQFAATVDDLDQGITLIVRGEDLLSSTGRQLRLGRMLGRTEPARCLHHPLVLKASGEKLSKAAGDTGVRELRAAGLTPADVVEMARRAISG